MKPSVFVTMLIVVGIILFAMLQMVGEANNTYDTNINTSAWTNSSDSTATSRYDFASSVNDSVAPIRDSINTISGGDAGFLDIVGAGFTGLIAAITFLPKMAFTLVFLGADLITGLGTFLGIPSYIILVFIIMLSVWGIFELVKFFQRWEI